MYKLCENDTIANHLPDSISVYVALLEVWIFCKHHLFGLSNGQAFSAQLKVPIRQTGIQQQGQGPTDLPSRASLNAGGRAKRFLDWY